MNNWNEITFSTFESHQMSLPSKYIRGDDLEYSLEGDYSPYFTIQEQVQPSDDSQNYYKGTQQIIYQAITQKTQPRAYTTPSKYWLNEFAFIDNTNVSVDILYSQGQVSDIQQSPKFDHSISIMDLTQGSICYDLDYIDQNTFVTSCYDKLEYYIIIINKQGVIKQKLRQSIQLPIIKGIIRIMKQFNQIIVISGYIVKQQSFIDVFQYTDDKLIRGQQLNSELINQITTQSDIKFNLIDFKISQKNEVVVLDQYNGVLQFQINESIQWNYVSSFVSYDAKEYFALDVVYEQYKYTNNDFKVLVYVIIQQSKQQFILNGFVKQDESFLFAKINFKGDNIDLHCSLSVAVIRTSQVILLIDLQEGYLVKQIQGQFEHVLANQYADQMIIFTKESAQTFTLSKGFLNIQSTHTTLNNTLNFVIVGLQKNKKCTKAVTFMIYDHRDSKLYNSLMADTFSLPSVITFPQFPVVRFTTFGTISGPNQQAILQISDNISNRVGLYEKLKIQGFNWPNVDDIWYVHLLTITAQTNFLDVYYFIQTKQGNCYIYLCMYKQIIETMECSLQETFIYKNRLQQNSFSMQQVQNVQKQIYYGILRKAHEIVIYGLEETESTIKCIITTSFTDSLSVITSFMIFEDYVYVVIPGKSMISIYSILNKRVYLNLDSTFMKQQGIMNWTPTQIHQNNMNQQYIMYIINGQYLVVGHFLGTFTVLKQIKISDDTILDVNLAIGVNTFLIMYTTVNSQRLDEYSISNINNIYFMKTLPLYHYELITPFQMSYEQYQGHILIKAYSPVVRQVVIMLYRSGSYLRESLFTTIPTGSQNKQDDTVIAITNALQHIYIYIKVGINQFNYQLYGFQTVTIEPKQTGESSYITSVTTTISYFNIDYPIQIQSTQLMQLVNLQTLIKILKSQIRVNYFELNNNDLYQSLKLNDDWFSGQILRVDASCFQCSSTKDGIVHIRNKLEFEFATDYEVEIIDLVNYGDNGIIAALTQQAVIFISTETQTILGSVQLQLLSQSPTKIYTSDGKYIIVITQQAQYHHWLQLLVCNHIICRNVAQMQLNNLRNVGQIQIVKNMILILDSNGSVPAGYLNAIHFYQIVKENNNYSIIELPYLIDYMWVKDSLSMSDFYVAVYESTYRLYATTTYTGILCVNLLFKNEQLMPSTFSIINFKNIVQDSFKFDKYQAEYLGIKPTKPVRLDIDIYHYYMLLTTYQSSSYGIHIHYNDTNNQFTFEIIEYVLLSFGEMNKHTKVSIIDQKVAITYFDLTQSIITIYQIPDIPSTDLSINPQLVIAGVIVPHTYDILPYFTQSDSLGTILIYKYDTSKLAVNTINADYSLVIRDTSLFIREQPIQLIVSNHYSTDEITIKLKIADDNQEQHNTELTWVVGGGVIFICILLTIALLCRYKHKKQKQRIQIREISLIE